MDTTVLSIKKLRLVIILMSLLVVILLCINLIPKIGKTKVSINVSPSDSMISINNKPSSRGVKYLKPGKYTFTAKRDGFSDDTIALELQNISQEIQLIPSPITQAAFDFLKNNPKIQIEREALGAQRSEQTGQKITNTNPLISKLPYTDIDGPFTIAYALTPSSDGTVDIIISDSSPEGRENAIKWIKSQGVDPSDLNLIFYDFQNPLLVGGGDE